MELDDLATALRACWLRWSADPVDHHRWSAANPSAGQCGVTALVVYDHFGGELFEGRVRNKDGSDGGFHYWNRLPDGSELDLTRDQFRDGERLGEPRVVAVPASRAHGRLAGQCQVLATAVRRQLGGQDPPGAIRVSVKGICRDATGRLLVCRNHRGEWELPGGRPELGELFSATLVREINEETGLAVEAGELIGTEPLLTPAGWVEIVAYRCILGANAEPAVSHEHTAVAFLNDAELVAAPFPAVYRRLAS